MKRIAIIGTGITGLTLATKLANQAKITLFEKARGVGGRMSTHYYEDYSFDFGVKYIDKHNDDFNEFILRQAPNTITSWKPTLHYYDKANLIDSESIDSYHIPIPKMTSFAKKLASPHDTKLNTQIKSIRHDNKWTLLTCDGGNYADFDWVILTTPPHQAYDIIPEQFGLKENLINISMKKCISIMLGLSNINVPFDIAKFTNSPIKWVIQNNTKPERKSAISLVIHTNPKWSEEKFDITNIPESIFNALPFIIRNPDYQKIHNWRFATYDNTSRPNFFLDATSKLAISGDWCHDGTVIGGFIAASKLAHTLERYL